MLKPVRDTTTTTAGAGTMAVITHLIRPRLPSLQFLFVKPPSPRHLNITRRPSMDGNLYPLRLRRAVANTIIGPAITAQTRAMPLLTLARSGEFDALTALCDIGCRFS